VPPPTPITILRLRVALELDQLLDQRQDRGLAAIEDALAADRDQGDVGEHPEIAVAVGLGQHAAVLQRLAIRRERMWVRPSPDSSWVILAP